MSAIFLGTSFRGSRKVDAWIQDTPTDNSILTKLNNLTPDGGQYMNYVFNNEMRPIELRAVNFCKDVPSLGLVTAAEAERILGIRKEDLSYYRARGYGLPYFKIGRAVRYCSVDIGVYKAKFEEGSPSREYAKNPFIDIFGRGIIIDPKTASKILTLSHKHLNDLRSDGGGPRFIRFGHYIRYSMDELISWLISGRVTPIIHR